jgi:hypothetical protein
MATNGLAMKVKEFEVEEKKESPHQKRFVEGTASTNAKTPMTEDNRMDNSFVTETPHQFRETPTRSKTPTASKIKESADLSG